jgi:ABC-type branched-subunit amino acid transport system permease subunit
MTTRKPEWVIFESAQHETLLREKKRGGTVGAVSLVWGSTSHLGSLFLRLLKRILQIIIDQSLIMAIGALGLSFIYGFAGQFSLGHAAFYGIGAYTAGVIGKAMGTRETWAWFFLPACRNRGPTALLSLLIGFPFSGSVPTTWVSPRLDLAR